MIINATAARQNLYNVIDEVITTEEPTFITSKKGNVVMLSENDYKAINETLYLLSIPGMREKLIDGLNTPLDECVEDPDDE
ncbi:type II toxin-antitoxin system Phd/YefM family antitoxin [Cloacibacillus sp. An23]|uniref:type II toxin-antitoxin system Phd/YefM family antitoxin n=1 Tax=Cloacibacillus sp. An23 TaxID=1965591 RepID=UPI000B3930BF|nr:type II toxin-antitoxin system Phd/YefM family antitoxin [Cloacibacillus sp. An23]OUO92580.1 antitoxin [Cloacibacillus sp. An23]